MVVRSANQMSLYAVPLLLTFVLAHARIIIKDSPDNFTCQDVPANFGPRIPDEGVTGHLVVAIPEDACSDLENSPPKEDWIALIVRSRHETGEAADACTFDMKVKRAEKAGAVAAIIYDDAPGWPFAMEMPAQHAPGPGISSVFITQVDGFKLKGHCLEGDCRVIIDPVSDYEDTVWMSLLLTAVSGMMAIGVVICIFYCVRRQREMGGTGGTGYSILRGEDGMTAEELRALPVVIHEIPSRRRRDRSQSALDKGGEGGPGNSSEEEGSPKGRKGGGTRHTCAICIEDYREGEKLRVLPCKHRFHMECIDQWLSARKPLCPICKWNALEPFSPRAADEEAGGEASSPAGASAARTRTSFLSFRIPGNPFSWRRGRGGSEGSGEEAPGGATSTSGQSESPGGQSTLTDSLLSATPENFPGMHAVRRNSERSLQAAEGRGSLREPEPSSAATQGYEPPQNPGDLERGAS
eukprot:jgi/Botrbrau1/4555/Bobra.60_2s0042.1